MICGSYWSEKHDEDDDDDDDDDAGNMAGSRVWGIVVGI